MINFNWLRLKGPETA